MSLVSDIAQAYRDIGAAQARGSAQSGAIWGSTLANIGQTIASLPAQMQQAKAMQAEAQLRQLQMQGAQLDLATKQREADSTAAFETALKNPQNANPDGTINSDAVANELRQKNIGAYMHWNDITARMAKQSLDTRKLMGEIATSDAALADRSRKAQSEQRDYLGKLAFNAEQMVNQKPDDPLHVRDTALASVARAAADGAITEQQAKDFLTQTATASPQQMRQIFGQFVPPDMRAKLEKEQADTEKARAEAGKAAAQTENLKNFGRMTPLKPPAVGSFEDYVTKKYGENPTPEQIVQAHRQLDKPPTINVNTQGEGLTKDAVEYTAAAYRMLGTRAIPTRISGPDRAKILNEAASQARAVGQSPAAAVTKQLTTKADAGALDRIQRMSSSAEAFESKALGQADIISELSQKVSRTRSPLINDVIQGVRERVTGDEDATKLANAIKTFSAEYAKIMEGSTGSAAGSSDSARKAADRLINTGMNKGTMSGVLDLMKKEMRLTLQGYDVAKQHITDNLGSGMVPASQAAPAAEEWVRDKNGKLVKKGG